MPSFSFNCRYVLLTYAQCGDLDPWAVVNHLSTLSAECIIGRENHADGGCHLHAFVDFGRKFRSRRSDIFDVGGRHPNVTKSYGNPGGGWDYAVKDGDVVAGGLERPSGDGVSPSTAKWSQIVGAESEQQFWDLLEQLDPKALCTNYSNLRKFADWRFRPEPELYEHPTGVEFDLGMVPDLAGWRELSLESTLGGKCCAARRKWGGRFGAKAPAPPRSSQLELIGRVTWGKANLFRQT